MLKHLAAAAVLIAAAPAGASVIPDSVSLADFENERIVDSCYAQFWRRFPRVDAADLATRGLLNHGRRTTPQQAFITSCTIGRGRMTEKRK